MGWLRQIRQQLRFLRFLLLMGFAFWLAACSSTAGLDSISNLASSNPAGATTTEQVDSQPVTAEGQADIDIVWTQGFLPEENTAITSLVAEWEEETGLKAHLTLFPQRDIIQETNKAVEAGRPPDVLFIVAGDTDLIPLEAWRDSLRDVSSILEPIRGNYTEPALEASLYPNNVLNERRYYAIPLAQQATNIHYWKTTLEAAGLREENIPSDWDGFWNFWKEAQDRLRQQGNNDIYGLGLCMSDRGQDTNQIFGEFLNAYGVEIVDQEGNLRLGEPENRERAVQALSQFVGLYQDGYVPQEANDWTDGGNNNYFLEGQSVLTANGTLSIPMTQNQPENAYNKSVNNRYKNEIRTLAQWPSDPDGSPHEVTIGIKQVVSFKDSPHAEAAVDFLTYLTRPEVVNRWLINQKGRFFPVMPQLFQEEFWANPNDPHLSAGRQVLEENVLPGYQVYSPAFSEMLSQKVLATAVEQTIDGTSPEQAIAQAIDSAEKIFAEFR